MSSVHPRPPSNCESPETSLCRTNYGALQSPNPDLRHQTNRECRSQAGMPNNIILNSLSKDTWDELSHFMDRQSLSCGKLVQEIDETVTRIWFPQDCIFSLIVPMEDGSSAQVAAVGHEGAVGCAALFGMAQSLVRSVVQVAGQAYVVEIRKFRPLVENIPALGALISHFMASIQADAMQSAACYALHPARARLARFLLMTQDRTGKCNLTLTQEALAEILGVQRTTVTAAALGLAAEGYISYRRGYISILDRPGLMLAACECYFRQLTRHPPNASPASQREDSGCTTGKLAGGSAH